VVAGVTPGLPSFVVAEDSACQGGTLHAYRRTDRPNVWDNLTLMAGRSNDSGRSEIQDDTSLARGLRLLLSVADHGTVRADALAELLNIPVSTVYRYLRTLYNFGFIDRHNGLYKLSSLVTVLPGASVSSESLVRCSDPILRSIVEQTGETALLLTRVGLSAVCLHQIESPKKMRMTFKRGELLPLHAGAGMKVVLAYAPPGIIEAFIATGLEQFTPDTPDEATLRRQLAQIRTTGIAVSRGEFIPGALAIAAPVFYQETMVAVLDVAGPAMRCGREWQTAVKRLLPEAASALGRELGAEVASKPGQPSSRTG
jgi:DNA-binding IclR family transcriptional regulator